MNTDIFVKKPVFAIVLNLLILALGWLSYNKLEMRLYPKVEPSVITITTNYIGASAADVETFITIPLEGYLSGLDGLNYSESTSAQNQSLITLHFDSGYDIKDAMIDYFSNPHITATSSNGIRIEGDPELFESDVVYFFIHNLQTGALPLPKKVSQLPCSDR